MGGKSKIDQSQTTKYKIQWVASSVLAGTSFSLIGAADEPFFKLDREVPFRESPLLPVLGGSITVASWSVRRVDVEEARPVSMSAAPAPVNKSSSLESPGCQDPRFPYPAPSPFRCVSVPSRAPRRCGPCSASSAVITVISVVSSTITSKRPWPVGGSRDCSKPRSSSNWEIRSWLEWSFLLLVSSHFLRVF